MASYCVSRYGVTVLHGSVLALVSDLEVVLHCRLPDLPPVSSLAQVTGTTTALVHGCSATLVHLGSGTPIASLSYSSAILSVAVVPSLFMVALAEATFVYDTADLSLRRRFATPNNCKGLLAAEGSLVAVAGDTGRVRVFQPSSLGQVVDVAAHTSAVSCLALSRSSGLLATCSVKGTLLRVFSGTNLVHEFRKYSSEVLALEFSPDERTLAVVEHHKVQLFALSHRAKTAASYLPTYLSQEWSFATVEVPQRVLGVTLSDSSVSLVCDTGMCRQFDLRGSKATEVACQSLPRLLARVAP